MVFVSAFAIGLCLGWLAGLSMSPVAQAVLTGLMALVAGAAGLAATKRADGESKEVAGVPIAIDARATHFVTILIVGVAIGAPLGIVVRTHNVLGTSQPTAQESPASGGKDDAPKQTRASTEGGGLFAGDLGDLCTTLSAKLDDEIVDSARASGNAAIECLAKDATSASELRKKLDSVCR